MLPLKSPYIIIRFQVPKRNKQQKQKQKNNRNLFAPRRYHEPIIRKVYVSSSSSTDVHNIATKVFGSSYYVSYEEILSNA